MEKYKKDKSLLLCDMKIIDEKELNYIKKNLMKVFISKGIFEEDIFMKILDYEKIWRKRIRYNIMNDILKIITIKNEELKKNNNRIEKDRNEILKLKNNLIENI